MQGCVQCSRLSCWAHALLILRSPKTTTAGSEVQLIEYRLEGGALSPFPLLRCRNIFVLPGIPALLQAGGGGGGPAVFACSLRVG